MHNITAIFFDLDGTVIDPETHTIPASTIHAIHALAKQGTKIFVATGRRFEMLPKIPGIMDLPWNGFICSNGQCIFDAAGTLLEEHCFTKRQVEDLIAFCKAEAMKLMLVAEGGDFAPLGIDGYTITAHQFFQEVLPEVIRPYEQEKVHMALIYNHQDYDFHQVSNIEGLQALPNQSTYADVVLTSVSKATGIDTMCAYYDIPKEQTMAIGDGGNDIEMLKHVHIGVAMGNAAEELKAVSDYVTGRVDEDGLRQALHHYQLLTTEEIA